MKTILFTAALLMGSAAIAQTTDSGQPTTTDQTTAAPSGETTDDGTVPGDGVTQQGTVPDGTATAPAGTNEPAPADPGTTVVPSPDQSSAFPTQAASGDYPPCSKTVTDHCIQTYEKGVRRSRR